MTDRHSWPKSLLYAIHQSHFLIEKRLAERLAEAGRISFSQFMVLSGIACCAKRSQSDIAEYLFLTEATVSRHVRTLIAGGLLTKKVNPKSKREFILSITTKGRREMERVRDVVEREIESIVSPLRTSDRDALMQAMSSLLSSLHASPVHRTN
jgi:DNA-binding MarR family transcriptional regulator